MKSYLSAFDFLAMGSSLSVRNFGRLGSSVSVHGTCTAQAFAGANRANTGASTKYFQMSVVSMALVGSSLSVRAKTLLGKSLGVRSF